MRRKHKLNKAEAVKKLETLLLGLDSPKESDIVHSLREIAILGRFGASAFHRIMPLVYSSDEFMRTEAMYTLVAIGMKNKHIAEALRSLLSKSDPLQDPYFASRIYWILERIEAKP
jgi:hypothetical protein